MYSAIRFIVGSLAIIILSGCVSDRVLPARVAPTGEQLSKLHLNDSFIANDVRGESCSLTSRVYGERLNRKISFIEELPKVVPKGFLRGTSLSPVHDDITFRFNALLSLVYTFRSTNNIEGLTDIKDLLISFAENEEFVDILNIEDIKGQPRCYDGGTKSACAQHTATFNAQLLSAIVIASVLVKPVLTSSDRSTLDPYIDKIYLKHLQPMARYTRGGYAEFGDYGIGVIAYADYTNNLELLKSEAVRGTYAISQKLQDDGYIDNNSYRGVRSYWYHTYGAHSMFSYALLLRAHGYDLLNGHLLSPRFKMLAEKTLEGEVDYEKFMSKGYRGSNITTNKADEKSRLHQKAVELPLIIRREYPDIAISEAYKGKPVFGIAGFEAECLYDSQ